MQGIYNYRNRKHVYGVYNVAAILCLQFMVHVMLFPILNVLYFYISTLRSTCAVPNMAVFCSSLIPYFPGRWLLFPCILVMLHILLIISGKSSDSSPVPSRSKAINSSPVNFDYSKLDCQSRSSATGNCLLPSVTIATPQ